MTIESPIRLTITEAARLAGVTPATIRRWERAGLVLPARTPRGHRRFSLSDVEQLRQIRRLRESGQKPDVSAIRASTVPTQGIQPGQAQPGHWADRLRAMREARNMSLREIARMTGLSPSGISAIERGMSSPSVASLQKLTAALGTSIVDVMETSEESNKSLVRVADRLTYDMSPGVKFEQLNFGPHAMEMHLITVSPGSGSGGALQHEGEEFMFVLEGSLEIWIDSVERYLLEPGDVLYFESQRLHEWSNPGTERTVFLCVNTMRSF